jgi:hypothetical protein
LSYLYSELMSNYPSCVVLDTFQQWISCCRESTCTAWQCCPSTKRKSGSSTRRPWRIPRGRKGCYSTVHSPWTFYFEGMCSITFVDQIHHICSPLCTQVNMMFVMLLWVFDSHINYNCIL